MKKVLIGIGIALSALALGCTLQATGPARPLPTPTPPPEGGIGPVITIRIVEVSIEHQKALESPDEASASALPLYTLLASASSEEFASVGLTRETALPILEQHLWRMHERVIIARRPKGDGPWTVEAPAFWPRLNMTVLTGTELNILRENIGQGEKLDDVLKPHAQAVSDGLDKAAIQFFTDLGVPGAHLVATDDLKPDTGRIPVYANFKNTSHRLPIWTTSTPIPNYFDVVESVVLPPSGFFAIDISWMARKGFPTNVIGEMIKIRMRENAAWQLYKAIGIWELSGKGWSTIVGHVSASQSVSVGSSVTVTARMENGREDAGGQYTITATDLFSQNGDTVYVQTSSVAPGEGEIRKTLARAARIAAAKLKPTSARKP